VRSLGSVLWLVPLATQIGYILATYDELPAMVGAGPESSGTDAMIFIVEWFAIVGLANLAFAIIHVRLPRLGDRMLAVPGRAHWLSSPERRAVLVDRLRGVCEITLLLLNVFFLAVYQNIYQTNVPAPVVAIQTGILVPFFMVLPLAAVAVSLLVVLRNLAAEARRAGGLPNGEKGR
jgi:hypothetical protein